MSIFYSAIVGSRSYGVDVPTSDTDVVRLGDAPQYDFKKFDLRPTSTSEFISDMFGHKPRWFFTQWLCPESFLTDTQLSNYISANNDKIIQARLPILYATFTRRADGLRHWGDKLYKTYPKRLAYSTLFYSILANYAEGMPFAKAHRPEGQLHDFLISMRLGQIPQKDAVARNELERLRAEKAAGFYKEAINPHILLEFEDIIQKEEK